jgi:hypothetical protein
VAVKLLPLDTQAKEGGFISYARNTSYKELLGMQFDYRKVSRETW